MIASHFSDEGEPELSHIIVLGAQMYESGPSLTLQSRLDSAYAYLSENEETLCIVSGGQGSNEPCTEAEGMQDYLVKRGIDRERIILEDASENTIENIRNSMEIMDPKQDTVGIVTSDFHVFRSLHIAKKQGIENVCGIAAESPRIYLPNNMFREFFGIIKDALKGHL